MISMHIKNTVMPILFAFPFTLFGQAPGIEWKNTS